MERRRARSVSVSLVCGVVAIAAVVACTSSSSSSSSASPGTATIGPEGGSVTSADGVATLDVPAGALAAPVTISIAAAAGAPPGSLVPAYAVEPSGTRFAKPALLALRAPAIAASDTLVPRLALDEGGAWQPVPEGSFVPAEHGVTGRLAHLSTYGVVQAERRSDARQDCKCAPADNKTCCDAVQGTSPSQDICQCDLTFTPATISTRHDRTWSYLDCMTDKGDIVPTPHGACAFECCRNLPGILAWTDGDAVVCESQGEWKGFDTCVDRCPPSSSPPCSSATPGGPPGSDGGADAAADAAADCGPGTACDCVAGAYARAPDDVTVYHQSGCTLTDGITASWTLVGSTATPDPAACPVKGESCCDITFTSTNATVTCRARGGSCPNGTECGAGNTCDTSQGFGVCIVNEAPYTAEKLAPCTTDADCASLHICNNKYCEPCTHDCTVGTTCPVDGNPMCLARGNGCSRCVLP